jgi:hypothetical protein
MIKIYTPIIVLIITMVGCNNGPKVITAENAKEETTNFNSGIFSEDETVTEAGHNHPVGNDSFTENLHTVKVNETLPTKKYVYMNVTEGGKDFWIASAKQDIVIGDTYFYRGGLLKTNFDSKEHNRLFDTIYLVTNIVKQNHSNNTGNLKAGFSNTTEILTTTNSSQKQTIPTHTDDIVQHKGSIKIAELVANPKIYMGKTIQITGKVIKVNPNIMNRNWLHLQDGSKNDFDLVVTTNTFVTEGKTITIKAKVSLDRDFGSGYRYDLILEEGVLIE